MAQSNYPIQSFPNTMHSVFYAYTIMIGGRPLGSFEKFDASFSRTHERIREVLFGRGPITKEIVWGATDISLTLSHVELYNQSVLDSVQGSRIFSIETFNQTVDVYEYMNMPEGGKIGKTWEDPTGVNAAGPNSTSTGSRRVIVYRDCVPTNITKGVDTGSVRIAESMTLECRTVEGFME